MKCPTCGNPRYGFVDKKHEKTITVNKIEKHIIERNSNNTLCKKCKYKGVEYTK